MSELASPTITTKRHKPTKEHHRGQPALTNLCKQCGHVENSHKVHEYKGAMCAGKCLCAEYMPQVDISTHNTADGLPPVELYKFQEDYLRGLPAKYIFAADTGVGKSIMALAHYDRLAYLKPLLILAPASKVATRDWEHELKRYFGGRILPEYQIWSYEKFSRVPTVAQYQKTGDRGVWRAWLQKHPVDFAVIADECHRPKNPQSKIGKAVFEVSQSASFFVGLSATPLPNGWIDAANYYKIFGFSRNITEFKKRYCEIATYKGFPEIVRYRHTEELQKYWNQIARPLSKDQALDLPPITAVPVSLPAGPEYVKVQKSRLFEDKFLDNPSAYAHALRQSIIEPKLRWLDEFLEGVSDNVVVFYNYKSERDAILKILKKNHNKRLVIRQDGEKHEIPGKHQWQDLHRTITLAQYQSGSTGIELTYAATIVYFSPTYSYSNYEQSVGRINRNGQTRKMTLYLLCSPATIELDIWAALRNKSDFQTRQWAIKKLEERKNHDN